MAEECVKASEAVKRGYFRLLALDRLSTRAAIALRLCTIFPEINVPAFNASAFEGMTTDARPFAVVTDYFARYGTTVDDEVELLVEELQASGVNGI